MFESNRKSQYLLRPEIPRRLKFNISFDLRLESNCVSIECLRVEGIYQRIQGINQEFWRRFYLSESVIIHN